MSDHAVFLIHGLWGNHNHFWCVESLLKEYHPSIKVHACSVNEGNKTYDGIDVGADRVLAEILDKLAEWKEQGDEITKFSIVGYSLGGLIARYVVGLMYSRGLFEKYTPVNFTTFATPHLGVRHANRTFFGSIAETLGPRLISASGRQMFLADRSRRPLLLRMSDKDSIFIRGLALFKTRIAYSNIINDRSVPYHTAAITLYNPYLDMTKLKMCYVPSYSPVIVHPVHPIIPISNPKYTPPRLRFIWLRILVFTLLPLWLLFFTVVSIYQSFFSARRIKAHFQHKPKEEEQLEETTFSGAVQEVFEDVVDNSNVLPEEDEEYVYQNGDTDEATPLLKEGNGTDHDVKAISEKREEYRLKFNEDYETMFKGLRSLQWHAIGVHIHKSGHSHAAIIRRTMFRREELSEGVVVIEHWLKELFQT